MTTRSLRRVCGVAFVLAISIATASAQSLDNKGDDFLLAFLPNFDNSVTTEFHLTSDVATTVDVEYPANAPTFTASVAVAPGTITIVEIPNGSANNWAPNAVQDNAIRATAPDEFTCYMVNRRPFSTDAALALPVDTMNTEFIAISYSAVFAGEFAVVAAFDNTTVEIVPSNALVGRPAGVPFSIVLNAGEAYFGISQGPADITGTLIGSDRPIGVTNGNKCANIPLGIGACDHIFEVAQPVQSWGLSAFGVNLPSRANGSIYRIVASEDGTTVMQDGLVLGVINRGEFIETPQLTGSHEFEGSAPIYVVQFMTGQQSLGSGNLGDPAMGNMIPSAQYVDNYTFATVGDGQFVAHFLTVVAVNADVGAVLLDGVAIPAGEFSPIGASGFSSALVSLDEGTHTTTSPDPHGITVEGLNAFDSYIYPGAALFQFINPVGDANDPICSVSGTTATSLSGSATDDRPSEDVNGNGVLDLGEDLNGNDVIDEDTGIFFVQLGVGATNLQLSVDPFVPGDGEATFVASLIDSSMDGEGAIVVTDGAGNQCRVEVFISTGTGCIHSGLGDIVGVDGGGIPTVFPTIQAALNDLLQVQVLVFTGNYAEKIVVRNRTDFLLRACGEVTVRRIWIRSSLRTSIEGFIVDATGDWAGVFFQQAPYGSQEIRVSECTIFGANAGVRIHKGNSAIFEDCTIRGCGRGVKGHDATMTRLDSAAAFFRCEITDNWADGVLVLPGMNALFEECRIADNGQAAIAMATYGWFTNEPEFVTLINNVLEGNNNQWGPNPSTSHIRSVADIIDATDAQPVF